MSEDFGSGVPPASNNAAARVVLSPAQLEAAGAEALRNAWRSQELYIEHLEVHSRNLEGSLERMKEQDDRFKQQCAESQHRERVLVRRLAAKEQEVQDYVAQIGELKSAQVSSAGIVGGTRSCMLDPAVNILVMRMKQELAGTRSRLEETQNEFSAWKFTPDSNTGKKLMAKCRLLHQENEDLGKMTTSGRIAKLEGDLALQKSFSEEVKKSQSELDEFLQELDEDVEGMQSTILFLQQELRASKEQAAAAARELSAAKQLRRPLTNGGGDAEDYDSEPDLILKVSSKERERLCGEEDASDSRTRPSGDEDRHYPVNGVDENKTNNRTKCESEAGEKRHYESDSSECSSGGRAKKQRRASVLSLEYEEDDDSLVAP